MKTLIVHSFACSITCSIACSLIPAALPTGVAHAAVSTASAEDAAAQPHHGARLRYRIDLLPSVIDPATGAFVAFVATPTLALD